MSMSNYGRELKPNNKIVEVDGYPGRLFKLDSKKGALNTRVAPIDVNRGMTNGMPFLVPTGAVGPPRTWREIKWRRDNPAAA